MKKQQKMEGCVKKEAIVEASLSLSRKKKDGSSLPSLAESLSHGERRKRGAKGPDSAK